VIYKLLSYSFRKGANIPKPKGGGDPSKGGINQPIEKPGRKIANTILLAIFVVITLVRNTKLKGTVQRQVKGVESGINR